MKKLKLLRPAFILSLLLTAVACGQNFSSIADKLVSPDEIAGKTHYSNSSLLGEVVSQGVPRDIALLAFSKYDTFADHVRNTGNMAIIDFTRPSGEPRLFLINTTTGHVDALLVAHGSGSDPKATGTPLRFSNVPNSKMSSLGAYIVNEKFQSTNHGTAARLDGLEATDSLVRSRAIILHSANYVSTALEKMGMSWGCPAVSLAWIGRVLARLSGGAFLYAYGHSQASPLDELQAQQLMIDPAYHWVNEGEGAPADGVF